MSGNTISDQQFGRLEGNVESLQREMITMREQNSREHGTVVATLEEIKSKLDAKADVTRVDNHAARIRELENKASQDTGEKSGAAKTLKLLQGAGVFGLMLLTYLAGKGIG